MSEHYPFSNPPLPYAYDALEPYIDARTMMLHHDRHLRAYTDNLNAPLADQPRLQTLTLEELLAIYPALPEPLATQIRNNAGGVYNHRLFFNGLTPAANAVENHSHPLYGAIGRTFGNTGDMLQSLGEAAMSVFGSGYAWLVLLPDGSLAITTTANQDTPPLGQMLPLLNADVWEHAYYLKHYNNRYAYLGDAMHVINWPEVEARYDAGMGLS